MTQPTHHAAAADAAATVTPALAALIAAIDHVEEAAHGLDGLDVDPAAARHLDEASELLRARLKAFPLRGVADARAKASAYGRLYPPAAVETEIEAGIRGRAFADNPWAGLSVELMKLADGTTDA